MSAGRTLLALLPALALGLGGCGIFDKVYDTSLAGGATGGGGDDDSGRIAGTEGGDHPGTDATGGTGDDSSGEDGGDEGGDDSGEDGGDGGETGGDAGGETGGDTGETSLVDCTPGAVPASGNIDECVSQTIACGQTVVATTQGGTSWFHDDLYRDWYCTPSPEGPYSGREKVFALELPRGQRATITLDSPCDELDVMALRWEFWEREGDCPYEGVSLIDCEMDDSRAGGEVTITSDFDEDTSNFLVVVEGPEGQEAPFALSVACE